VTIGEIRGPVLPLSTNPYMCGMGYCDKPAFCFYNLGKYGLRAFCEE